MEYVVNGLIGAVGSLIASFGFLYVFLSRKIPIIYISNYISREQNKDGASYYWFKYINKTNVPIYDVQVAAYFLTPQGGNGGQNLKVEHITVKHKTYTHVPAETKNDKNALHAVQVRVLDDLDGLWSNTSTYLRFEVIAKHELSGFSKVFVQDYHSTTLIKSGSFKFGNDLEII